MLFFFVMPIFVALAIFMALIFSGAVVLFSPIFLPVLLILILPFLFWRRRANKKILDSSLFIDGRIVEIINAGYFEGPFVIPKFILSEIHRLSDSDNSVRRAKGRRALDNIALIQAKNKVEIDRKNYNIRDVDTKLIKLAKHRGATLVTTDFNLTKVASIEGVNVVNINLLSVMVRKILLPGEELIVDLVKKGDKDNQAIGYLEDGTMVVVEDAPIGKKIKVVVSSTYPTQAGRIVFAKLK